LSGIPKAGQVSELIIHYGEQKFTLCTLRSGTCDQAPFELNLFPEEEVKFEVKGPAEVHLIGYIVPFGEGDEELDSEGDEEGESDEEIDAGTKAKMLERMKKGPD
jgi:hypothetical protein